jgi:hypothetical protein
MLAADASSTSRMLNTDILLPSFQSKTLWRCGMNENPWSDPCIDVVHHAMKNSVDVQTGIMYIMDIELSLFERMVSPVHGEGIEHHVSMAAFASLIPDVHALGNVISRSQVWLSIRARDPCFRAICDIYTHDTWDPHSASPLLHHPWKQHLCGLAIMLAAEGRSSAFRFIQACNDAS